MGEVAGDGSLLVDFYDVKDICGALLKVLCHEDLRRELGLKGLKQRHEFSWKKYASHQLVGRLNTTS
jgi:hypothetical protein